MRQVIAGANWSATIANPFRSFGSNGRGLEGLLSDQYADATQPIMFLVHLAHPRVKYSDRGKSAVVLKSGKQVQFLSVADDLIESATEVTLGGDSATLVSDDRALANIESV